MKNGHGMAHLVPVVSLAADGAGDRADDPGHCHFDGRAASLALVEAKGNLRTELGLVGRARRELARAATVVASILICCPTSARVMSRFRSLVFAWASE